LRSSLKRSIGNSLETEVDKSVMKSRIEDIKNERFEAMNTEIKSLLDDMKKEIEGKIQEFKDRMQLEMGALGHNGTFQLDSILEALEISFKYIASQVLDVGLSIWAS